MNDCQYDTGEYVAPGGGAERRDARRGIADPLTVRAGTQERKQPEHVL